MSEQPSEPDRPSVPARLSGAFAAIRASIARKPVPWVIGGLAAVLVLGSGGAVAVASATAPTAVTGTGRVGVDEPERADERLGRAVTVGHAHRPAADGPG